MPKALLSFGFSLLVLLSGFSWHIEEHHCMGRVMDRAFLGSAESCGMEQGMIHKQAAAKDQVLLSSGFRCCDDVTYSVEKQEELQDVHYSMPLLDVPQEEAIVLLQSFSEVPQSVPNSYRPPPLPHGRDRLNWLQIYRI